MAGTKNATGIHDLTGQRFGRLTVTRSLSEREDRYVVYLCRCDCGREVRVNSKKLRRGTVQGCPDCWQVKSNGPLDLTGQVFGELKVVARSQQRKSGRRTWECLCSCGKTVLVTTHDLRAGHCVSCGDSRHRTGRRFSDLTGMRIGSLTVLTPTSRRDKKGSVIWRCRCDCGRECEYTQDSLIHGGRKLRLLPPHVQRAEDAKCPAFYRRYLRGSTAKKATQRQYKRIHGCERTTLKRLESQYNLQAKTLLPWNISNARRSCPSQRAGRKAPS